MVFPRLKSCSTDFESETVPVIFDYQLLLGLTTASEADPQKKKRIEEEEEATARELSLTRKCIVFYLAKFLLIQNIINSKMK